MERVKMSCFICDDKTINRILTYLSFNVEEFKLMDSKQIEKFGQKMVKMNYDAFFQRYSKDIKTKPFKFIFKDEIVSVFQALKSLKCFLYQCSEGNIEKRKLYKKLNDLEFFIMSKIINKMEEYDKAEWG